MKTYTTDTGIKLLFPIVPKGATNLKTYKTPLNGIHRLSYDYGNNFSIPLGLPDGIIPTTILGACWREGDKQVCEGFDPEQLIDWIQVPKSDTHEAFSGFKHYLDEDLLYYSATDSFDSWARREGIEIAEGEFMNVVLKVN